MPCGGTVLPVMISNIRWKKSLACGPTPVRTLHTPAKVSKLPAPALAEKGVCGEIKGNILELKYASVVPTSRDELFPNSLPLPLLQDFTLFALRRYQEHQHSGNPCLRGCCGPYGMQHSEATQLPLEMAMR